MKQHESLKFLPHEVLPYGTKIKLWWQKKEWDGRDEVEDIAKYLKEKLFDPSSVCDLLEAIVTETLPEDMWEDMSKPSYRYRIQLLDREVTTVIPWYDICEIVEYPEKRLINVWFCHSCEETVYAWPTPITEQKELENGTCISVIDGIEFYCLNCKNLISSEPFHEHIRRASISEWFWGFQEGIKSPLSKENELH